MISGKLESSLLTLVPRRKNCYKHRRNGLSFKDNEENFFLELRQNHVAMGHFVCSDSDLYLFGTETLV